MGLGVCKGMSLKDAFLNGCVLPTDIVVDQGKDGDLVAVRSIEDVAREIAGCHFEQSRSKRFRQVWGTSDKAQDRYVSQNWRHFVEPARQFLVQQLSDPAVSELYKERIYQALVADRIVDQAVGMDAGITQISPGTEQFHGDKFVNREIDSMDN